jgi:Flp pilus assembly CpaE family ATPase
VPVIPELASVDATEIDSVIERAFSQSTMPGGDTERFERVEAAAVNASLFLPTAPPPPTVRPPPTPPLPGTATLPPTPPLPSLDAAPAPMAMHAPTSAPQRPKPAPAAVPPPRRGRVILVFGCRGGAGATTVATNLAGELAGRGDETLLIDLDLQLGDTMVALDINGDEAASFANLAREYSACEDQVLKRRLARHRSGLYVLAQHGRLEELDGQLVAMVPAFFEHLRGRFDTIVIDGVRDFAEVALAALDLADVIALVATQDVAAIRRARRVVEVLDKLEVPPSKRQLIINRHHSWSKISTKEIERAMGMPVALSVKNDYATALKAQNRGALVCEISKSKRIARDLGRMTTLSGGVRS